MAMTRRMTWQAHGERISGEPLPGGLDAAWDAFVGMAGRFIPRQKRYLRLAEKIVGMERQFSSMPDAKLRQTAAELRERFRRNRDTVSDIEQAFALIREVAARQIGEMPYMVQVAGALALQDGSIAEMATGEGKTLAASLAVTVAGWRGRGCHVITVNDYLARRDSEWMGAIYRFCGLTVSCIEQLTPPDERRTSYLADITYCTNKEVAADFLRDRLVLQRHKVRSEPGANPANRLLQRGLYSAIVDEADSILIDEAVTPLIISGSAPNPDQEESFKRASVIADQLERDIDYTIDSRYREVELTDQGKARLKGLTDGMDGFWKGYRRCHEVVYYALTAKELYLRDKHYIVDNDRVVIIDEFTGRLMPDRSWRDGLHQAVEAKEGVAVTTPKDTYARISFQRFFRLYKKLAGMTGTAAESTAEFWKIYHLPVVRIPTNRPCIREILQNIILPGEADKWARIVEEVKRIHQTGRPILIGTRSVRASEQLSRLLKEERLEHQVLNAVYHRQEAQIVVEAGHAGKITVATNMAGRGTDIKLERGIADIGGLHVIAAEPNDADRIDRQLYGRCARQGDPGSSQGIFSLEEELLSRYSKTIAAFAKKRYAGKTSGISSTFVSLIFRLAQYRSKRLSMNQRRSVLKTDFWLDEQLGFTGRE